jgi:phosphoribosylformylglycinamidine (FGAM) synthase PurS component
VGTFAVVAHFNVEADSAEAAEEQILALCEASDANAVTVTEVEVPSKE